MARCISKISSSRRCNRLSIPGETVCNAHSSKKEERIYEIFLQEIQNGKKSLEEIPAINITSELCLAAVKLCGWELEYVPKEMHTAELCMDAVQQHGRVIACVPQKMRTYELCLAAVQQDGRALKFVPEKMRTPELYLAAIQQT